MQSRVIAATLLLGSAGCGGGSHVAGSDAGSIPIGDAAGSAQPDSGVQSTGQDIANLALANVNGTACGMNSLGDTSFDSSCTGNDGSPEYWCSDFARWVWNGVGFDASELTAGAGSFYAYGVNHGTLSPTPAVGAAAIFDYEGQGYASHVGIVTQVNADGTIESISGDWNGDEGSEAQFASTSHVLMNTPAYDSSYGFTPGVIGYNISGYVLPKEIATGTPSSCAVHDDGKLYCGMIGGMPLFASPMNDSDIVDHLRANPSWFDCWGVGDLHAGGNTTWYHSQGDDYGALGWTPAVNVDVTSSFDANPTAAGMKQCQ